MRGLNRCSWTSHSIPHKTPKINKDKINVYSTKPTTSPRVASNAALFPVTIRALFPVGAAPPVAVAEGFPDVSVELLGAGTAPPMAVACGTGQVMQRIVGI